jgi:protein tyrosine/serine phosphatase
MKRALGLMLLLVVPPLTAAIVHNHLQYPRRFAEVEPGTLFRGGYPSARQVRELVEDRDIRTIVNLAPGSDDTPDSRKKEELMEAARLGVEVLPFPMPGDGKADYPSLDAAADALAEPKNRPVYFHCAAGKMRSNAALAAYRMKHCRWSLGRALDEARRFGLDDALTKDRELAEHLAGYERHLKKTGPAGSGFATTRQASSAGSTAAGTAGG